MRNIGFGVRSLSAWDRAPLFWPCFVLAASAAIAFLFSPYKGAATFTYLLLLIGILHRRNRSVHVKLMSLGMAIDVLLVLVLEIQRSAIGTVSGGHLSLIQASHVMFSLLAVLLYVPVAVLGYRRLKEELMDRGKKYHFRLGVIAFGFRTLGYILMFSMTGSFS